MVKRGEEFIKIIALINIFLIILAVFSFIFILSETNLVSAQIVPGGTVGSTRAPLIPGQSQPGLIERIFQRLMKFGGKIEPASVDKKTPSMTAKFSDGTSAITESRFFVDKGAVDITLDGGVKISNVYGIEKLPGGKANFLDSSGKTISGGENIDYNEAESAIKTAGGSLEEVGGYKGPLGIPGGLGYLAQGLSTALLVVGGIQLVGGLLGLDDNQQEALSTAAGS